MFAFDRSSKFFSANRGPTAGLYRALGARVFARGRANQRICANICAIFARRCFYGGGAGGGGAGDGGKSRGGVVSMKGRPTASTVQRRRWESRTRAERKEDAELVLKTVENLLIQLQQIHLKACLGFFSQVR